MSCAALSPCGNAQSQTPAFFAPPLHFQGAGGNSLPPMSPRSGLPLVRSLRLIQAPSTSSASPLADVLTEQSNKDITPLEC